MPTAVTRVAVTRKIGFLNRAIEFMLDDIVTSQDASERLLLSGWAIHRTRSIEAISLKSGSATLISAPMDIHRPGVLKRYGSSPNADCAGFRLELPAPETTELGLVARLNSGKEVLLAELSLESRTEPRLLFMHIPKAAGSFVNRYLAQHFADKRHAIHIESNAHWERDPDRIRKLDFVSGHVTLPRLAAKLNIDDYVKVTVIREPFSQVVSHLAWVRRLADPGEESRLNNHPAYIQSFARKLAATRLDSATDIQNMIAGLEEPESRLVENCQTRYFTLVAPGRTVDEKDLKKAVKASGSFDVIGATHAITQFLKEVSGRMGWAPPEQRPPENVSRGYYGLEPGNPDHRDALLPLVRHDLTLYDTISRKRSLR